MQHYLRLQKLFTNLCIQRKDNLVRTYLTTASQCNDVWKTRFQENLIKTVNPLESSYKILQKESEEKTIHAIDLDIFVNSITSETLLPVFANLKNLMEKFRTCTDHYKGLPSTNHTFLRLLINAGLYDDILYMVGNCKEFGIFFDVLTAKLFMNKSLIEGKYADAASCATHLMLQEEFSSRINTSLAIHSCIKYLCTENQEAIINYKIPVIEPEDDVIRYCRYMPNNCFDDHFDLTDDKHFVGKTLVYAAIYVEDNVVKHNATVLGWSLFEKWENLQNALETAKADNISVSSDVSSLIEKQIEKCENEELSNTLKDRLQSVTKNEEDETDKFMQIIEKHLQKTIAQHDNEEIEKQNKLYDTWNVQRNNVYENLQKHFRDTNILAKITKYKENLQNTDDYVHYWDNEEDWKMRADRRADEISRRKDYIQRVTAKEKEDVDYIIPEMSDMEYLKSSTDKKRKVRRVQRTYVRHRDIKDLIADKSRTYCGFHLYGNWRTL